MTLSVVYVYCYFVSDLFGWLLFYSPCPFAFGSNVIKPMGFVDRKAYGFCCCITFRLLYSVRYSLQIFVDLKTRI